MSGNQWVLDRLFRMGGQEAVWPEVTGTLLEMGFVHADVERAARRARTIGQVPREWLRSAAHHSAQAERAEADGHRRTAAELHLRASGCLARARWGVRDATALLDLYERMESAYDKAVELGLAQVERVAFAVDEQVITGLLHLPAGTAGPVPGLVVIPGMDMCKEYVPPPSRNVFAERGMAVLTIDPPGHGRATVDGPPLATGAVERAVREAAIVLARRPEVDGDRIGVLGIGTGASFAASTVASSEPADPIRAVAGIEGGFFYDTVTALSGDQPARRARLSYMSGLSGAELDELVATLGLEDRDAQIAVPLLLVLGEFDELTSVAEGERLVRATAGPSRLVVHEGEGHVLGGVMWEAMREIADWLHDALSGRDVGPTGRVIWREEP